LPVVLVGLPYEVDDGKESDHKENRNNDEEDIVLSDSTFLLNHDIILLFL
jgi:hypothetical protein